MTVSQDAVLGSALWAAYGDAIGFVTELTDTTGGVKHRCGYERVTHPLPWRRRLGGRTGVDIHLPAGSYSDDTQLRLATSRAIRGDGEFDVDAFARVELVAWQTYHLGAGRGSKAAAAAMARADARWSQNMFATKAARYVDVGGNGAAMRIQPHVWSAHDLTDTDTLLRSVLRDAVVTHGHPVGILGAALHALVLARTLVQRRVPAPREWAEIASDLNRVTKVVDADDELAGIWLPAWENAAQRSFPAAVHAGLDELRDSGAALARIANTSMAGIEPGYHKALEELGGLNPATRGSGVGTAWLATYVALTMSDPEQGLAMVANTLGSDTDTIATMAGALVGGALAVRPPGPVQDHELIASEAKRMHAIALGQPASTFRYPDLLTWAPPRSALDLIGSATEASTGEHLELAGLGSLENLEEPVFAGRKDAPIFYRWATLARTGQRVIIRHRATPEPLAPALRPPTGPAWAENRPAPEERGASNTGTPQPPLHSTPPTKSPKTSDSNPTLFDTAPRSSERSSSPAVRSVEELVSRVVRSDFDAKVIGAALLEILNDGRSWQHERASAYAALVADAYAFRRGRKG